jgi:hypothetical protein
MHAEAVSEPHSREFTAKVKSDHEQLAMTFAAINPVNRSAQLIGNLGAANVQMVVGSDRLTFVETTLAGNVNVTAVSADVEPSPSVSLVYRAVHSRSANFFGQILASQYYGICTARD